MESGNDIGNFGAREVEKDSNFYNGIRIEADLASERWGGEKKIRK